jgi:hypothetical protein
MDTSVFRHAAPTEDPKEWWTLIRQLASRLYAVDLSSNDRVPPSARALRTRLGVSHLPPSLVQWMAFLTDLKRTSDWASEDLESFHCRPFPECQAVSLRCGSIKNGWVQWGVAIADFTLDDPPVGVYGHISTSGVHVLRKNYRPLPLTQFALHSVLDCAGSNYRWMGSDLDDPEAFLCSLPASVPISASFANLRFMEGEGWLAYVCDGATPSGRQKRLTLRFTNEVRIRDIPKIVRDQVQLKPRSLRSGYHRKHRC